ncbi:TetR/AcrR family transcriptional regulator [Pseudomonadota bacterium]
MNASESVRRKACDDVILRAAADEFAEKGFGGARVDEIAQRANVNKATLYYRIGDKEAIYHAVLDMVLGCLADNVCLALSATEDSKEKIRQFVKAVACSTERMGCAAPILLREVAGGGQHLPDHVLVHMNQLLGALDGALADGFERGLFRQANSFFVHMMVIGSIMLYAVNEPIRRRISEQHAESATPDHSVSLSQAAEQVSELVLAALHNTNIKE